MLTRREAPKEAPGALTANAATAPSLSWGGASGSAEGLRGVDTAAAAKGAAEPERSPAAAGRSRLARRPSRLVRVDASPSMLTLGMSRAAAPKVRPPVPRCEPAVAAARASKLSSDSWRAGMAEERPLVVRRRCSGNAAGECASKCKSPSPPPPSESATFIGRAGVIDVLRTASRDPSPETAAGVSQIGSTGRSARAKDSDMRTRPGVHACSSAVTQFVEEPKRW